MRRAFLFDLDGVLINSEKEYTRIWETIEKKYPTGVENFALKIKGTTLEDILDRHFPDPVIRPKVEDMLYELEAAMTYQYCDGAKELLETLKERNIPMSLYTSSNSYKMNHLYKDLPDIKNYFGSVITGEMVTESKPNPEGYIKAAKSLGYDPKDCIVVEDSLQGVRAGHNAGAYVIGVAGTLPAHTLEPEADFVVDSIGDITDKLDLLIL